MGYNYNRSVIFTTRTGHRQRTDEDPGAEIGDDVVVRGVLYYDQCWVQRRAVPHWWSSQQ